MTSEDLAGRRARIERALARAEGTGPAARLCGACAAVVHVGGASIMVMTSGIPTMLCASDDLASRLEDLQKTLGEGPGLDAHRDGVPVLEPDLSAAGRWSGFRPEALAAGAGALFSFPMLIGGVTLGALSMYAATSAQLSDEQYLDARAMTQVAANAVLSFQARARVGELSPELDVLATHPAELNQAAGMVSVQLGVDVAEAMVRLRAHAYASGRPLAEVAADVVARRLRLQE